MQLVIAATGMVQKECFALALLCKAPPVAGIVLLVTTDDDVNVGAATAGPKTNLPGGRAAEARPKMINDQEAEAATREDPATAVRVLLGWPQLQDSSEQRDSQSLVTRRVELLFLGRL